MQELDHMWGKLKLNLANGTNKKTNPPFWSEKAQTGERTLNAPSRSTRSVSGLNEAYFNWSVIVNFVYLIPLYSSYTSWQTHFWHMAILKTASHLKRQPTKPVDTVLVQNSLPCFASILEKIFRVFVVPSCEDWIWMSGFVHAGNENRLSKASCYNNRHASLCRHYIKHYKTFLSKTLMYFKCAMQSFIV